MESRFLMATEFSGLGGGYSVNGLLESHDDVTIIMCVYLCLENLACLGIFYNEVQRKCFTNKITFFKTDSYVKEEGWRYYRTSGGTQCKVTENFIHNRQLEMCYMPQADSKNWTEAISMCESKKANLVKIDSSSKQDHLRSTIKAMAVNVSKDVDSDGYAYQGCYAKSDIRPTFKTISPRMTIEMCSDACQGKPFIQLMDGYRCYCVSDIPIIAGILPVCTIPCLGDSSQICGGEEGNGPVFDTLEQVKPPSVDFYIGLTKAASDWIWCDNEVAVYTSFANSESGTCAAMSSQYDFRWKSVECTSKSGFICEI